MKKTSKTLISPQHVIVDKDLLKLCFELSACPLLARPEDRTKYEEKSRELAESFDWISVISPELEKKLGSSAFHDITVNTLVQLAKVGYANEDEIADVIDGDCVIRKVLIFPHMRERIIDVISTLFATYAEDSHLYGRDAQYLVNRCIWRAMKMSRERTNVIPL